MCLPASKLFLTWALLSRCELTGSGSGNVNYRMYTHCRKDHETTLAVLDRSWELGPPRVISGTSHPLEGRIDT